MTFLEVLTAISNVATAIAVGVAAWQLVLNKKQAVTNFEDSFAKQYRELIANIPLEIFFGDVLSEEKYQECFDEIYRYLDLCNEQIFLYKIGRISEATWQFWVAGISENLSKPVFQRAWVEIAEKTKGNFSELREFFPPQK